MKKYINLQIGNRLCTLPDNGFDFSITKRISDGLSTAGGKIDRPITLPADKVNIQNFERWDNAAENNPDGIELKPCTLSANGLILVNGAAQLSEVEYENGTYAAAPQAFKVNLFDGNSDWIARLGDLELRQLDWENDQHVLSSGNIFLGFSASYPTDNYGYMPAKIRDWTIIPPALLNAGQQAVTPSDCVLFVFIPAIIEKIGDYLGINIKSDYLTTAEGASLIMPLPFPEKYGADYAQDYLNVKAERTATRSYTYAGSVVGEETLDFTVQTYTPPIGVNPFTLSTASSILGGGYLTGRYTAKATGFYNFKMSIRVNNISGGGTWVFQAINVTAGLVENTLYTLSAADNGKVLVFDKVLPMTVGDDAEFYLTIPALRDFDIDFASIEIIGEATIGIGTPIDIKYLLSNWKCKDLLKGLGQIPNLKFETADGTGTTTVEPLDDYLYTEYPSTSQINGGFLNSVTNWHPKWDLLKKGTDSRLKPKSRTVYTYKEDSNDPTVQALEEGADLGLFSAAFDRDNTIFEQGVETVENAFFAATISIFDDTIKTDSSIKTPLLPLFWKENFVIQQTFTEKIDTYEPRIMFFVGQRGGIDGYIRYLDSGVSTEIELPFAYMVNFNDLSGNDPSLSYCNYTINGKVTQGLMQRFYLKSLVRTRQRECFILLNDLDINQLTFRSRIFLNGLWWVLQSVESYSPLNDESTKVVLLLDTAETDTDYDSVVASVVKPYIEYN